MLGESGGNNRQKCAACSLKGVEPNELSFTGALAYIVKELTIMPAVSAGRLPDMLRNLTAMAEAFILPTRRERQYPRVVKRRLYKYPVAESTKSNASQA
ncbi:MAG: hypothetical protein ACK4E7_16700 [Permianibacter sp.]